MSKCSHLNSNRSTVELFEASGISGKDQQEKPYPSKGLQARFPTTTHTGHLVPGGFSTQGTPATSPSGRRVATPTPFHSLSLPFGQTSFLLFPSSSILQMLPRSPNLLPSPWSSLPPPQVSCWKQQPTEIRLVR